MKIFLLISLMLLSTHLLHEAQGIRLEKESILAKHDVHEFQAQKEGSTATLVQTNNRGVIGEVLLCKDGRCSGMNRKLLTKTASSSAPNSEKNDGNQAGDKHGESSTNEGQNGKKEKFSVKSSTVPQHGEVTGHDHYPDVLDLAGMDYSPARRKSPIHN